MRIVTSPDGTNIAYDIYGNGPAIIMVNGTMNSRIFGPAPAAKLLAKNFTVYDYDRRGRGGSGDNQPYTPQKEVEDIAALVDVAGGQAALCGFSAGAALAMEATIQLGPHRITKLAMYEGPYTNDPTTLREWQEYGKALQKYIQTDSTDDLVLLFLDLVHAKDQAKALRRNEILWQKLVSLAPTLTYDYRIIGPSKRIPKAQLSKIKIPTLLICGEASGPAMMADTKHIAALIPHAKFKILPGQAHSVDPEIIAPVLDEFLGTKEIS